MLRFLNLIYRRYLLLGRAQEVGILLALHPSLRLLNFHLLSDLLLG